MGDTTGHRRRWRAVAATMLGLSWLAAAAPVARAADVASATGFATGTVIHADALRTIGSRLADVEVGFSSASHGISAALRNEVGRLIRPAGSIAAYGRGSGLELGVNVADDADNQLILAGKAEAQAPILGPIRKEIGPIDIPSLVSASLLRGEAAAPAATAQSCLLGADLSSGRGEVSDVELVGLGGGSLGGSLLGPLVATKAVSPLRDAVSSFSHTRLVPQVTKDGRVQGGKLGIMSETRQTILPVTLFGGTPSQVTIEVLGEWVLRAVATGKPGGAYVHFGPAKDSPETPVVRIIQSSGITSLLTLQQLLGNTGLNLPLGIADISIGEAPRRIGGAFGSTPEVAGNGTHAAAAVDVVRVTLLDAIGLADVRVGHMEASATVPAGGVTCEIPVTKTPHPQTVKVGESFTTDVVIRNVFECPLGNVRATDEITTLEKARYEVLSSSNGGTYDGDDAAGEIAWQALGSLVAGGSKTITARFEATDGPGVIHDKVTVRGTCGVTTAEGDEEVDVTVTGTAGTDVDVKPPTRVLGNRPPPLPKTGVTTGLLMMLGAAMLASSTALGRWLHGHPVRP